MTMTTQKMTHGAVGHWCFKCGTSINSSDGVVYLGHYWCLNCARGEARAREALLRKKAEKAAASLDTGADKTSKKGTADPSASLESQDNDTVPAAIPGIQVRVGNLVITSSLAGAAIGGLLLSAGLVVLLWTAGAGLAGPALTLAGAILLAAVVRR